MRQQAIRLRTGTARPPGYLRRPWRARLRGRPGMQQQASVRGPPGHVPDRVPASAIARPQPKKLGRQPEGRLRMPCLPFVVLAPTDGRLSLLRCRAWARPGAQAAGRGVLGRRAAQIWSGPRLKPTSGSARYSLPAFWSAATAAPARCGPRPLGCGGACVAADAHRQPPRTPGRPFPIRLRGVDRLSRHLLSTPQLLGHAVPHTKPMVPMP
jgi:hypothetical protein